MEAIYSVKNQNNQQQKNHLNDNKITEILKNNFTFQNILPCKRTSYEIKDTQYQSELEKIIQNNNSKKTIRNYIADMIEIYYKNEISLDQFIDKIFLKNIYVYEKESEIYSMFLSKQNSIFHYLDAIIDLYGYGVIDNDKFIYLIRSALSDKIGRFEILLHAGNIESINNFHTFIKVRHQEKRISDKDYLKILGIDPEKPINFLHQILSKTTTERLLSKNIDEIVSIVFDIIVDAYKKGMISGTQFIDLMKSDHCFSRIIQNNDKENLEIYMNKIINLYKYNHISIKDAESLLKTSNNNKNVTIESIINFEEDKKETIDTYLKFYKNFKEIASRKEIKNENEKKAPEEPIRRTMSRHPLNTI